MEVRPLRASLTRCREILLLPFLAPSVSRAFISRPRTHLSIRQVPQRSFAISTRLCEEKPPSVQQRSRTDFAKAVNTSPRILDLLDSTIGRTRPNPPPKGQSYSSADLVENPFRDDLHRPEGESRANRQGSIFGGMRMPGEAPMDPTHRAYKGVLERSKEPVPRNTATIKSRPSLGRTIDVTAKGVAVALMQLEGDCRRNNVRADQKRQRFHERPGLKRKRLKSERWRKRFRIAFKATVQKVQEMRKKGW